MYREWLRPEPVTVTCNICAYYNDILKTNGTGQNINDIGHHNQFNSEHLRRVGEGRLPPPTAMGVYTQNPIQFATVVRCIPCTLDEDGWPQMGSFSAMQPLSVEEHIASNAHIRIEVDGRLQAYRMRHVGHPGRLANEVW